MAEEISRVKKVVPVVVHSFAVDVNSQRLGGDLSIDRQMLFLEARF
jgi:hypothetical protein